MRNNTNRDSTTCKVVVLLCKPISFCRSRWRCRRCRLSTLLLLSKNFATMVTWRSHFSPLLSANFRIVIVHRSADKVFFALVRLGKLVGFWTESVYSPREICIWQIVSTQRFVNDKFGSGKPSKCLQLYTPLWILLLSVFRSIVLVKLEIFSFGVREFSIFLRLTW